MNLKRTIGLILVIAGVILGVSKALGSDTQSGGLDHPALRHSREGGVFLDGLPRRASLSQQFGVAGDRFFGTGFLSKTGRQEVHFSIARDAGKFECEGFPA